MKNNKIKKSIFFLLTLIVDKAYAQAPVELASSPVSYSANVLQMLLGLFAIVFMIVAVVWLMKKAGFKSYGTTGMIKIKSCLPISNKEKILLIEVGDEQILIGTAPGFIGHLKTLEKPVTVAPNENTSFSSSNFVSSAFAEKLKAVINKNEMVD